MKSFAKIILKKAGLVSYNEKLYFYLESLKSEKSSQMVPLDNFLLMIPPKDKS